MKSILMLLFVFGCVAVVYVGYWANRAAVATKEAAVIFKETGSLTETARRLYAHETAPDASRMSSRQREYVAQNLVEFLEIHRDLIETEVARIMAGKQGAEADAMDAPEIGKMVQSVFDDVATRYAKNWCEVRGIM